MMEQREITPLSDLLQHTPQPSNKSEAIKLEGLLSEALEYHLFINRFISEVLMYCDIDEVSSSIDRFEFKLASLNIYQTDLSHNLNQLHSGVRCAVLGYQHEEGSI